MAVVGAWVTSGAGVRVVGGATVVGGRVVGGLVVGGFVGGGAVVGGAVVGGGGGTQMFVATAAVAGGWSDP